MIKTLLLVVLPVIYSGCSWVKSANAQQPVSTAKAPSVIPQLATTTSSKSSFMPPSFSADYEESFVSSLNGQEKKSFGRIDYKFPRHIRFEVVSPDPTTFVANPKTSWYYRPPFIEDEEGQVTIQKSDDMVLTKFLDALKNGAKTNAAYTVKSKANLLTLVFSAPLQKDLQMTQAVLVAAGDASKASTLGEFKELLLHYKSGKKVRMKFLSFRPNLSFPADHFEFRIPAKTKIIEGK